MGGKRISAPAATAIVVVVLAIVGVLAWKFVFSNNQSMSSAAQAYQDKMRAAHSGAGQAPGSTAGGTQAPSR